MYAGESPSEPAAGMVKLYIPVHRIKKSPASTTQGAVGSLWCRRLIAGLLSPKISKVTQKKSGGFKSQGKN